VDALEKDVRVIRCPICGRDNTEADEGFPLCSNCHTDLVVCEHCVSFENGHCTHPREYVHWTPDGNGAKECPAFHSHFARAPQHWRRTVPAPVWVTGLLLLVVITFLLASLFIDREGRYFQGEKINLETVVPARARAGERCYVVMRIANPLDRTSTHLYIEVQDPTDLVGVPDPVPDRTYRDAERVFMEYAPLAPGGWITVKIPFLPRDPGVINVMARLYAPRTQFRQEVPIKIEVVARRPSGS
jgi:hypothetical protein